MRARAIGPRPGGDYTPDMSHLDELDEFSVPARDPEITEGFFIDGEEPHRGAVFGGHVRYGGLV